MNKSKPKSLPVIADCRGCGVCCFHMGYPAFVLPRDPMTDDQIDADPELVRLVKQDPGRRLDLQTGNPGESYWHAMPEDLRSEWEAFVAGYEVPDYGDDLDSFDGPCFWLDLETRQCKHHQYRPQVCRDFDAGSSECHQWRDHYRDKILSPFEFSIQQKRANRHASKITEPSTPGRE